MQNLDLISFTLQYLYRQLSVYVHHLSYRNYYISNSLCAGVVQLQLISQTHYINYSYTIHTILISIVHSCKWHEISDR
jgi:hypothetical protein